MLPERANVAESTISIERAAGAESTIEYERASTLDSTNVHERATRHESTKPSERKIEPWTQRAPGNGSEPVMAESTKPVERANPEESTGYLE